MNEDILKILQKIIRFDGYGQPFVMLYGAECISGIDNLFRYDSQGKPFLRIYLCKPRGRTKQCLELYLN